MNVDQTMRDRLRDLGATVDLEVIDGQLVTTYQFNLRGGSVTYRVLYEPWIDMADLPVLLTEDELNRRLIRSVQNTEAGQHVVFSLNFAQFLRQLLSRCGDLRGRRLSRPAFLVWAMDQAQLTNFDVNGVLTRSDIQRVWERLTGERLLPAQEEVILADANLKAVQDVPIRDALVLRYNKGETPQWMTGSEQWPLN